MSSSGKKKRFSSGSILIVALITAVGGFYLGTIFEQEGGDLRATFAGMHDDLFPENPNGVLVEVDSINGETAAKGAAASRGRGANRDTQEERYAEATSSGGRSEEQNTEQARGGASGSSKRAGGKWEVGDPQFRAGNMGIGYVSSGIARRFGIGVTGVTLQAIHDLAMPHPDLERALKLPRVLYPTREEIQALRDRYRGRIEWRGGREQQEEAIRKEWERVYGQEAGDQ